MAVLPVGAVGAALIIFAVISQRSAGAADTQALVDAEKNQIEEAYASQMAAAPTARQPKDPVGAAPPPESMEPWPAGIFDDPEAPFPAAKYQIQNRWQGGVGDNHAVVYAGALGDDPNAGVLVVQVYSADLSRDTVREVRPAGTNGSLRILAAKGLSLTVEDSTRHDILFDVAPDVGAP